MASSPLMFSSEFESSSGSEVLSVSSGTSSTQNFELRSISDMGLSTQPGVHGFGGFFSPPGTNASGSQPTFSSSSSLPTPSHTSSFSQATPYGHVAHPTSNSSEELRRMRNERDHWRTKYHELKAAHDDIVMKLITNIATASSEPKTTSTQVPTSLVTAKQETSGVLGVPTTSTIPSNAPGDSQSLGPPFAQPLLPQLDRANYKNIRHWDPDEYNVFRRGRKGGGENLPTDMPTSSVLSIYMEDEDGRQVSEKIKRNVRKTAKAFFEELLKHGKAPTAWGYTSLSDQHNLTNILEREYPFLRFCEGHWKAGQVATNSYSQWYGNAIERNNPKVNKAGKGRDGGVAEAEVIDIDSDENKVGKASKRPRDEVENTPGPSKRPRVEDPQLILTSRPRPTPVNRQGRKDLLCESSTIYTRKLYDTDFPLSAGVRPTPSVPMIPTSEVDPKTPRDVGTASTTSLDRAPTSASPRVPVPLPAPSPSPSPAPVLASPLGPVSAARAVTPALVPASPLGPLSIARAMTPASVPPLDSAPSVIIPLVVDTVPSPVTQKTAPALLVETTTYNDAFVRVKDTNGAAAMSRSSGGPSSSALGDTVDPDAQSDAGNVPTTSGTRKKPSKKAPVTKRVKVKKPTGWSLFLEEWKEQHPDDQGEGSCRYRWSKLGQEGKQVYHDRAAEMASK